MEDTNMLVGFDELLRCKECNELQTGQDMTFSPSRDAVNEAGCRRCTTPAGKLKGDQIELDLRKAVPVSHH